MNNFITRAITGVLFVAIIVVCFLRPQAMIFLFALITGLTLWEFCGLVNEREQVSVNRFICTIAGVYFFLAMAGYTIGLTPVAVFIPYLLTLIYLFVSELYLKAPDPIHNWAYTMLSQMYIALPFSMVCVLAFAPATPDGAAVYNYLLPLSVFIFLWLNDTGAYCTGMLWGRHRLFERISPKKSWEGSIGGGIVAMAGAVVIALLGKPDGADTLTTCLVWMGLALVVVVFGTLGDLVESLFKRTLGIKDSGNILPGHGGMLDRFDSALMALPAAVVYWYSLSLL
ncbi:MAG: phosphatidate cytidylyltransferase [Bacteroidaceae bacterium]|nr:phosphatidate cytidylyltransferase [Bacteroidaceae bacterium]